MCVCVCDNIMDRPQTEDKDLHSETKHEQAQTATHLPVFLNRLTDCHDDVETTSTTKHFRVQKQEELTTLNPNYSVKDGRQSTDSQLEIQTQITQEEAPKKDQQNDDDKDNMYIPKSGGQLQSKAEQKESQQQSERTIDTNFFSIRNQPEVLESRKDQQTQLFEVRKNPVSEELTLTQRKGPNAPIKMRRGSSTLVGNIAYFNTWDSRDIFAFNCNTTQWSTLPQCTNSYSTLTNINNQLTAVGGQQDPYTFDWATNKLLTYQSSDQQWVEQYPPMPTRRYAAGVVSTNTHVVVLGGFISDFGGPKVIRTVEVMDLTIKQWSTASPLPYSICLTTTVLCGDTIYLTGGHPLGNNFTILSCSIGDLLRSSQSNVRSKLRKMLSFLSSQFEVWHKVFCLRHRGSTCVSLRGQLLAIGGYHRDTSNAIYKYNGDTCHWDIIGRMNIAREFCLAMALPNDEGFIVVGGETRHNWTGTQKDRRETNETEIFIYSPEK